MKSPKNLRTWIEIDAQAFLWNASQFFKLIPHRARLMAMVKSNAYGHGLWQVSRLLAESKNFRNRVWLGVDSLVEALRLRREGIKNNILVVGYVLPERIPEAVRKDIVITVSSFSVLNYLASLSIRPRFHIKIDTGMHRQGFLAGDLPKLLKILKENSLNPEGIYSHAAMADNSDFIYKQFKEFLAVVKGFKDAGFKNFTRHFAATGAALKFPRMHLDMARIGLGLYGYSPLPKTRLKKNISLRPVLSWKTIVSEIKKIPAGSYVGYDLTERMIRPTNIAILPVGYWHGYDRGFSSKGEILIGGKRRRVLGRVSMDMMTVDVSYSPKVRIGDEAVIIGHQGKEIMLVDDLARKIGTTPYEILTRINPLIERLALV